MSVTNALTTATDQVALELLASWLSNELKSAAEHNASAEVLRSIRCTWPKDFDKPELSHLLGVQRRNRTWPGVGSYVAQLLSRGPTLSGYTPFSKHFPLGDAVSELSGETCKITVYSSTGIRLMAWWSFDPRMTAATRTWTLQTLSIVFPPTSNKRYNGPVVFIFRDNFCIERLGHTVTVEETIAPGDVEKVYA